MSLADASFRNFHARDANVHRSVLLPLLAVDLVLLVAHYWPSGAGRDLADAFRYLQWALLALTFAAAAWRWAAPDHLAWALLFAYLLCVDVLALHQRTAMLLVAQAEPHGLAGLQAYGTAKLAGMLAVATLSLPLVAAAWQGSDTRTNRDMLVLLVALACFGIVVDALQALLRPGPTASLLLDMLERTGEIVTASLMLAYAAALYRRARRPAYAAALAGPRGRH